ncbi:MAG: hypothetical protein J7M08_08640 [Planctomycetes bacterium]|nr:hypothetical protein [Planctomycetota bacterium]
MKRPLSSWWWVALGALALLALGGGCYALLRDDPPPEDGDLQVQRMEIPVGENGWQGFIEAAALLVEPEGGFGSDAAAAIAGGKEPDEGYVKLLFEDNGKALRAWEAALRRPYCQVPEADTPEDMLFPALEGLRELALFSHDRAIYLAQRGETAAALDEALRLLEFGHKVEGAKGALIHFLVGVAIEGMGLDAVQHVLKQEDIDTAALTACLEKLNNGRDSDQALKDTYKVEYAVSFAAMEAGIDKGIPSSSTPALRAAGKMGLRSFFYKPNRTRRIMAKAARMGIDNVSRPYSDADYSGWPSIIASPGSTNKLKLIASGNSAGAILIAMLTPAYDRIQGTECLIEFRFSAVLALTALRCYRDAHGRLPQRIEELVPQYLDEVPRDPFDGKPLRYSKDKKIVYSVGTDLTDSGGSTGDFGSRQADPTVHIEF